MRRLRRGQLKPIAGGPTAGMHPGAAPVVEASPLAMLRGGVGREAPGVVRARRVEDAVAQDTRIVARGLVRDFVTGRGTVRAMGPIDVDIRDREFCCVVGPSGCGKSTFLKIVAGLAEPSAGTMEVRITGESIQSLALVFQDYGIYPWKTAEENVAFGLELAGMAPAERRERTRSWLAALRLEGFESSWPRELSGGMRQRVAIARALAVEPEILLMDEPFAAVDPQLRVLLQDEVLRLWQRDARTVVMVTHSLEEALVLSDRVLVMSARPGRLLADVRVPFARPRDESVRSLPEFVRLHAELWERLRSEVVGGDEERP